MNERVGIFVAWISTFSNLRGHTEYRIKICCWTWGNPKQGDLASAFADKDYFVFCFDRSQYSHIEAFNTVGDEMEEAVKRRKS